MPLTRRSNWKIENHNPMSTLSAIDIETKLHTLAEEYSRETYPAEHRHHLGISIIGDDCSRKLWYSFRWVKLIQHEGRMRRLFNRGHHEEPLFEKFLLWQVSKLV